MPQQGAPPGIGMLAQLLGQVTGIPPAVALAELHALNENLRILAPTINSVPRMIEAMEGMTVALNGLDMQKMEEMTTAMKEVTELGDKLHTRLWGVGGAGPPPQ